MAQADVSSRTSLPITFKVVHLTTLVLFVVLLLSGAVLYVGSLEAIVGDRALVAYVHVYSGLFILVPFLLSLSNLKAHPRLASVYKQLSQWSPADRASLFGVPLERSNRFNGGQKLMANALLATLIVLLISGVVMASYIPLSISMRQGATFVHDLMAFIVAVLFTGHLLLAIRHPQALRSIFKFN